METGLARDRRIGADLITERSSWITHWRDLEQGFMPRRGKWLTTDHNRGDRRTKGNINNTPIMAIRALVAGMTAGMTSPARPWFRLIAGFPELMEVPGVREWLYHVEQTLRDALAKGNFYQAIPQIYRDLGVMGSAAMLVEPDDEDLLRFYPFAVGSYCVANGPRLTVNTIYREITRSVRQVVDMFGIDKVSEGVKQAYRAQRYTQTVEICHLVEPNTGRDKRYADNRNMAYRSAWWEKTAPRDEAGGKYLRESGFRYFPVVAPRWDTAGDDAYGQSPAMEALGDAKALQVQEKRLAQAIDKFVDPPMVAKNGTDVGRVSIAAGSLTLVDDLVGGHGFYPAVEIAPAGVQYLAQDIARLEGRINHACFKDLFLMLASLEDRERTAEEIRAREGERLLMLGPVIERLSEELLDRVITIAFQEAMTQGLLPEPPLELQGRAIKVEYISVLATAQRAVSTTVPIERVIGFAGMLAKTQAEANAAPTALDKIDFDQAIDEYAVGLGGPPTIVRSDEAVAAIREQRQQAEQAARAAEMAATAAKAAKDLGSTPMGQDSALDRLVGA